MRDGLHFQHFANLAVGDLREVLVPGPDRIEGLGGFHANNLVDLRAEFRAGRRRSRGHGYDHFRRMELETIGTLPLDAGKVAQVFPGLRPGTSQAINDISIANSMRANPASSFVKSRQDTATIPRIDQLLTS